MVGGDFSDLESFRTVARLALLPVRGQLFTGNSCPQTLDIFSSEIDVYRHQIPCCQKCVFGVVLPYSNL